MRDRVVASAEQLQYVQSLKSGEAIDFVEDGGLKKGTLRRKGGKRIRISERTGLVDISTVVLPGTTPVLASVEEENPVIHDPKVEKELNRVVNAGLGLRD